MAHNGNYNRIVAIRNHILTEHIESIKAEGYELVSQEIYDNHRHQRRSMRWAIYLEFVHNETNEKRVQLVYYHCNYRSRLAMPIIEDLTGGFGIRITQIALSSTGRSVSYRLNDEREISQFVVRGRRVRRHPLEPAI